MERVYDQEAVIEPGEADPDSAGVYLLGKDSQRVARGSNALRKSFTRHADHGRGRVCHYVFDETARDSPMRRPLPDSQLSGSASPIRTIAANVCTQYAHCPQQHRSRAPDSPVPPAGTPRRPQFRLKTQDNFD
ncbi:hypothetical protein SR858_16720 [Duganella zoogloeoides]|uniref:GIY-YIG nuclease family protein n=1 Tax=Duganella zoogloeoides TaxID=75659 RepID=A0ABZ0XSJ2_9BURK|nr:hypothetical protein [Duganella zoogloeoides]WQH02715.1 hypothetical protein SR858_16720 [Duganella zoogloeoides]